MNAILFVYSVVTTALLPLLLLGFALSRRGRTRIGERLGSWHLQGRRVIWLHGASVGEINGLLPLVPRLKARWPEAKLLMTATSTTGLERARPHVDECRLLPFDQPGCIRRALQGLDVALFLFAETELWPVLLSTLKKRNVPILLVNARISDYSYPRYRRLALLLRPILGMIDRVLCSDERSAERFRALGVDGSRAALAGNAKFDRAPSIQGRGEAEALRARLFAEPLPTLVLASVWPGEETIWFEAIAEVCEGMQQLPFHLIVAPRHLEKLAYFESALESRAFSFSRYSDLFERGGERKRVLLVDRMGVLEPLLSIADLAFIGASLVDQGGHNPLEASAYHVAVAMGPYTSNVGQIATELEEAGALLRLRSSEDVSFALRLLVRDPEELRERGQRGGEIARRQQGAAERVVAAAEEVMEAHRHVEGRKQ